MAGQWCHAISDSPHFALSIIHLQCKMEIVIQYIFDNDIIHHLYHYIPCAIGVCSFGNASWRVEVWQPGCILRTHLLGKKINSRVGAHQHACFCSLVFNVFFVIFALAHEGHPEIQHICLQSQKAGQTLQKQTKKQRKPKNKIQHKPKEYPNSNNMMGRFLRTGFVWLNMVETCQQFTQFWPEETGR